MKWFDVSFAVNIMDKTRTFFAGHGFKTCNKVYMKTSKDYLSDNEYEQRRQSFMRHFASAKATQRNENRDRSWIWRDLMPSQGSPYEVGKALWTRGQQGDFVVGNCLEMAYVSAYLAIDHFNTPADQVHVGKFVSPGDHVFCLIGPKVLPNWQSVMHMKASTQDAAFVIDPWLHVACQVAGYYQKSLRSLTKWHQDGKRVWWWGANKSAEGWYAPTGSYAEGFVNAGLTFEVAKP